MAEQWHPTKNGDLTPSDVKEGSGKSVWWLCEKGHEWKAVIGSRATGNGCPYCSGKRASTENNLQVLNPDLAKQWHPTKNGDLTPSDITVRSAKKVWWTCEKDHEWDSTVANRTSGNGCPYCAGKRVWDGNSLHTLNPDLAKQWHPSKNGELTPNDVTIGSGKKAWWICDKGHEWEAAISSRIRGNGCPFCAGQRVGADNSLQTLNSDLAKQWHPTKNGTLTPNDVTLGSSKKVWWQCDKGHEWEAVILRRRNGARCPLCNKLQSDTE